LATKDVPVIRYDQRAAGLSERPRNDLYGKDDKGNAAYDWSKPGAKEAFSLDRHVKDLEELRKALGVEKLVLLPHSWGGMIAQLKNVKVPVAVLAGDAEPFGDGWSDDLAHAFGVEAQRVPNAGHDPQLEQPRWTLTLLKDALSKVTAPTPAPH